MSERDDKYVEYVAGKGWYWYDETWCFGNTEPCKTRADALAQQKRYCEEEL